MPGIRKSDILNGDYFCLFLHPEKRNISPTQPFISNKNMITADQLKSVLEREQALRGYL
jgi:hypothetical protein